MGKLPTGPLKKSSSLTDGSVLSGIETDGTALGVFVGDGCFTGDLVGKGVGLFVVGKGVGLFVVGKGVGLFVVGKGVGLFEGGMMGVFVGGCTTAVRRKQLGEKFLYSKHNWFDHSQRMRHEITTGSGRKRIMKRYKP